MRKVTGETGGGAMDRTDWVKVYRCRSCGLWVAVGHVRGQLVNDASASVLLLRWRLWRQGVRRGDYC